MCKLSRHLFIHSVCVSAPDRQVVEFSLRVWLIVCSILDLVKPKTVELVFVASLVCT